MLPATKRSFPSSWNPAFVSVDVVPPSKMFVLDPNAPT
jgi:hypothetical protein